MFLSKTKCMMFATVVALATTAVGCSKPMAFSRTEDSMMFGRPIEKLLGNSNTTYAKTAESFTQDQYDRNTTTVQFRVTQGQSNVSGLKKEDIVLTESNININSFQMQSNTESLGRKADIVFVIDDTGSMQKYIDSVKLKVSGFVQALASTNIQANLCLVTFGDQVSRSCTYFVEDDPNTSTNENLNSFLNALSTVKAGGGGDIPENQLEAMMVAASQTPWHSDAQRIAVLMTDAEFHYAPDNLGHAVTAPTYQAALDSIINSNMMTFAVAPDMPGYSKSFNGMSAFPTASLGDWYNLADIISGAKDLDDIFDSIINQLSVVYVAKYVVEDYAGLDASLPLTGRTIKVEAKDSGKPWKVRVVNVSSNLPAGRPQYKSSFSLQTNDYRTDTLSVTVNGRGASVASLSGKTVNLSSMPAPGATIRIEYFKSHLRDNLMVTPISFRWTSEDTEIEVVANGFVLEKDTDYTITHVEGDTYLLNLSNHLLEDSDPLRIVYFGGLNVGVFEK